MYLVRREPSSKSFYLCFGDSEMITAILERRASITWLSLVISRVGHYGLSLCEVKVVLIEPAP